MNITIHKMWSTETTIVAPDNLTEEELTEWIANNADEVANDNPMWDGTVAMDEDDNEIASW